MNRIHWTTPTGLIMVANLDNGAAVIETTNGRYFAPVTVKVTGRVQSWTCAGTLGMKARITVEAATVSGWVS